MDIFKLPSGFQFAGVHAGIKPAPALDLALVYSATPCTTAAVFTQNRYAAAPVQYDRALLARNNTAIRAVLINSGIANAVTGEEGLQRARHSAEALEAILGLPAHSALVMSTGVIGESLPLARIEAALPALQQQLGSAPPDLEAAAGAIMTTDTRRKIAWAQADVGGQEVTVTGFAKGAGMIHPNMATMLAVIVTDAAITPAALQKALRLVTDQSFNRISVDGDTSTNDTVAVLANGEAGQTDISSLDTSAGTAFVNLLSEVAISLAQAIVRDGEGSSKFVSIDVSGLSDDTAAHRVANTIATSLLVKTAIYGGDANWGRILAAAGASGVDFDPAAATLTISGGTEAQSMLPPLHLLAAGTPLSYQEEDAAQRFAQPEILIELKLGDGPGRATVWTCDLSHEYITINGEYRT